MTDVTDLFLSLTPDVVLAAVDAAGVRTNPVCYTLNSFENRVYEIELCDESRVVAKFYRPGRWTRDQIREEHTYLADLEADEVPVCGVRPFPDGDTVATTPDGIHYCIFERKGGRAPDELSDAMVERLGMLTARLHNVGARRDAPTRWRMTANVHIRENLRYLGTKEVLPYRLERRYFEAANDIADIIDSYIQGVPVQRIHGDLHLGNLIQRDDILHVLDFDDMVVGPPVQDIWLVLPGRDAHAHRQREIFLEGYEHFRAFDRTTLRLIEPLRALRFIHYATWLARRWHDPAFPQAWPHFGTEAYWEQETQDLEDQLRLIKGENPTLTAPIEAPKEELSNKDFFWDWDGD